MEIIERRLRKRLDGSIGEFLYLMCFREFYIAGGALLKKCNDYDLYPKKKIDVEELSKSITCHPVAEIIYETKNAITVDLDGIKIQFCNYVKDSLEELLSSFDFAHCQIGAEIKLEGVCSSSELKIEKYTGVSIEKIHITDDFTKSMISEETYFTGSEYPLSSLLRLAKYKERGLIPNMNRYAVELIRILVCILKRGYENMEDFKDQLDAVDLQLLDQDLEGMEKGLLMEFFELLKK